MSDFIWLIHADSAGNPTEPGTIGHFVLVSDTPQLAVNEFDDNGKYEHADCGPACILSALAARGQHPTATAVELACGTGGGGTQVKGVSEGLGHFGVVNGWQRGEPSPGWIMNPAGGRIIPPSEFPSYLAASQGWIVSFASVPVPAPPPVRPGDAQTMLYQRKNGSIYIVLGASLVPLGDGADATYLHGLGIPFAFEADITVALASILNALPVIS